MAKAARRLGRGLDALVGNSSELETAPPPREQKQPATAPSGERSADAGEGVAEHARGQPGTAPIDSLRPNPLQPRSAVQQANLGPLVESIRQSGILQPIVCRQRPGGLEIVAGERRWQAAKLAGLATVPIAIRDATDEQMLEFALIENIQREDLNAIDRANGYREFADRFGLSLAEVAARLGEDRTTVTNYVRLLELAPEIQQLVVAGSISMGHARSLLGVPDSAEQTKLAKATSENQLSVRALEELVRRRKTNAIKHLPNSPSEAAPSIAPNVADLQRRFERAIRTKVTIREGRRKGTGRITIEYYSYDDFDRIAELLGVEQE